jgi:hypothetical protein
MKRSILAVAVAAALVPAAVAIADHAPGHDAVRFTVRVENVSTASTLALSTGGTAPAPTSPVVWAVSRTAGALFTPGKPDAGLGMEALAEDGNPEPMAKSLANAKGVRSSGFVAVPVGDREPGPALPGKRFEFTVTASPGDRLSFAMMFGQSNDLWIGTDERGIALFEGKRPIGGDVTGRLHLWDQGTEVNEEPGVGPHQGPRQSAANTGPAERKPVGTPKDAFTYPAIAGVVKVTVMQEGVASK